MNSTSRVFVSGGTGYIGTRLIKLLLDRSHSVTGLVRRRGKLPSGATELQGNALDASTFTVGDDTFVHLVGVSHPAPWKQSQFRAVDLASVRASVAAAVRAGVKNFVYVSVA